MSDQLNTPIQEEIATPNRWHHWLSKPMLQMSVVVVGFLLTVVTAYGIYSGNADFFFGAGAQSNVKSLALNGGEQGLVSCAGKMTGGWLDPKTQHQLRVFCSSVSTTPTPKGTPVPPAVLPSPLPTATAMPGMPSPSPVTGTTGGGSGLFAASFGAWDPANPLYAFSGPMKYPVCPKAVHDSFKVLASDGKWYPTWHPPVTIDPATGKKCAFGHDHGDDPSKSAIWTEIQQHYYYDANHNGVMDPSEQAVAGLPFGFASEQLDVYSVANGTGVMRHENAVGFKVTVGNGEADATGGNFNTNTTGGIVVPIQKTAPDGFKWTNSGASCYLVQMIHMGVFSNDAFTNNLHEVAVFQDCKGPTTAYNQKVAIDVMAPFGAPGEFTNLCTAQVPEDRTTPVVIGTDAMNKNYPGVRGVGGREILQRSCIAQNFLVPEGKFTPNFYEEWDTSPNIVTSSGKTILSGLNLAIDVEDTIRYYDPSKPNNLAYTEDLCYEVLPNGNRVRGGSQCYSTGQYPNETIKFNDTRAGGKGIHRGMYFHGPKTDNAGGPETWYTDPFGGKAQTTPFPGSVMQTVSSTKVDYGLFGPIDPRQIDKTYDDGEGTVHAPN